MEHSLLLGPDVIALKLVVHQLVMTTRNCIHLTDFLRLSCALHVGHIAAYILPDIINYGCNSSQVPFFTCYCSGFAGGETTFFHVHYCGQSGLIICSSNQNACSFTTN